ncbi:T9SS type A sorting domain-containing protein [candidate division WOR-3 bacterium]|nr:T9SS type A sorting domain-containing protein [candidate division WOR-3 bacterium]
MTVDDVVISEIILGEFDETFEIYGRNGGGTQTTGSNIPITYYISIFPNPAKNDMTISFGIPREEMVVLNVYDLSGREVKKLVDSKFEAGYHTIKLNHMSLPSGIYFARLVTDGFDETKKIVLIK